MPGQVRLEWFDTVMGKVIEGGVINGGQTVLLQSPLSAGAVLYLRPAALSQASLTDIEIQAQSIRQASMSYAPWPIYARMIIEPYLNPLVNSYRALVLSLFTCVLGGVAVGCAANRIFTSSSSI